MNGQQWSTLGILAGIFGAVASGIGSYQKDKEFTAQRMEADAIYRQQLLDQTRMVLTDQVSRPNNV